MITQSVTSLVGQDINLAMKGLLSLERFLGLAASAVTDREIIEALNYKLKHAKAIAQECIKMDSEKTCIYDTGHTQR